MACGCKDRKGVASQTSLMRGAGGYLNLRYGDDGIRYSGPHEGEQVFIVGKGTVEEKVFTKDQLVEASAYSHEMMRVLLSQTAGNLPRQAMADLYGESLEPV